MNLNRNIDVVVYMAQYFHMDCPVLKYAQMTDTHSLGYNITGAALCLLAYPLCEKHPIVFSSTTRQPLGMGKLCAHKANLFACWQILSCMCSTVLVALFKYLIDAWMLMGRVKFNWWIGRVHMHILYVSLPHSSTGNHVSYDNDNSVSAEHVSISNHFSNKLNIQ